MSTTNTDFLPNTTGLNLGSPDQRWDGFFDDITVVGNINGIRSADSVQILSTSQTVGFANAVHTMILATGGSFPGITLSLPNAALYPGQVMKIKKMDLTAGAVTISGSVDGAGSYALTNQYQFVALEAGGGSWNVVGGN